LIRPRLAGFQVTGDTSCTGGQLTSSLAIANLVTQCDNAQFPDIGRSLILSPNAYNSLIKNPNLATAFNYGSPSGVQDGVIPKVGGFNVYKTTATMPGSDTGIVCNNNAILTAFGKHAPNQVSNPFVTYDTATDKNGVVISMKSWYQPLQATTYFIIECLFGNGLGNTNALFQMK
jgi:hypothetical protein